MNNTIGNDIASNSKISSDLVIDDSNDSLGIITTKNPDSCGTSGVINSAHTNNMPSVTSESKSIRRTIPSLQETEVFVNGKIPPGSSGQMKRKQPEETSSSPEPHPKKACKRNSTDEVSFPPSKLEETMYSLPTCGETHGVLSSISCETVSTFA